MPSDGRAHGSEAAPAGAEPPGAHLELLLPNLQELVPEFTLGRRKVRIARQGSANILSAVFPLGDYPPP